MATDLLLAIDFQHRKAIDFEHRKGIDLLLVIVLELHTPRQALWCLLVMVRSRSDLLGGKQFPSQPQLHRPVIVFPRASVGYTGLAVGIQGAVLSDFGSALLQLPCQHQPQLRHPLESHLFHAQNSHPLHYTLLFRQSSVVAVPVSLHTHLLGHKFLLVVGILLSLSMEKMHCPECIGQAWVGGFGSYGLPKAVFP